MTDDTPIETSEDMAQAWTPPQRVKCDGNHGGQASADPGCWQNPPPATLASVIACLGDDAAQLRTHNAEDERAANMDRAALLLGQMGRALRFYAERSHFSIADGDAWDTVSGEPQNYWCDDAGTATVEDGEVARAAIAGNLLDDFDAELQEAKEDLDTLRARINTPELVDFPKAVHLEAVHQEVRWGTEDREGKTPYAWFWLLSHLASRALEHHKNAERLIERAELCGDPNGFIAQELAFHREKAAHHCITSAAALSHWHASVIGKATAMRPGSAAPAELQEATAC